MEIGNERVEKVGTTFNEIVKLVKESSAKITEFTAASEEISAKITRITLIVPD